MSEEKSLFATFLHEISWGDPETAIEMMYQANEKMGKMQKRIDELLKLLNVEKNEQ